MNRACLSPAQLRHVVERLASRPEQWAGLVRYDTNERWYHRLSKHHDQEVWLLSWLPGQKTGFHDHGESAGAFAVAFGALCERTISAHARQPVGVTMMQGTVRSFGPQHIHEVSNVSHQLAVSIHAYSPPLTTMRRFELTAAGLVPVTVDTSDQW
jgi:predicted metal-dependent enzyme (double-stranded beta helix superfamily)